MNSLLRKSKAFTRYSFRLLTDRSRTSTREKPSGDPLKSFYYKDLILEKVTTAEMKSKPSPGKPLPYGRLFADHMCFADFDSETGWTAPSITPLRDIRLHPSAKVFHYACELFEGMKAFRGVDNKIRIFRPELNMERMRRTAERSALPDFDGQELIKLISHMVSIDKEWVPDMPGSALYIRPTFIGSEATLGVNSSNKAKLFVFTSPVGSYYATGFKPTTLLADSQYVRAAPGGVGAYKMGCNYAATFRVGKVGEKLGCQQTLWLYGKEEQITEGGTMNIFIFWKNEQGEHELVTPSLDGGLILPGVTRNSLLALARDWKQFKVTERVITMADIKKALKENRMLEMFTSGTAVVVSPVGKIVYKNRDKFETLTIPTMENKPNIMQKFYKTLTDIQYGRVEYKDWVHIVQD